MRPKVNENLQDTRRQLEPRTTQSSRDNPRVLGTDHFESWIMRNGDSAVAYNRVYRIIAIVLNVTTAHARKRDFYEKHIARISFSLSLACSISIRTRVIAIPYKRVNYYGPRTRRSWWWWGRGKAGKRFFERCALQYY